jgi:hypothetical protein
MADLLLMMPFFSYFVSSPMGQRAAIAQVFFSLIPPEGAKMLWNVPGRSGMCGAAPMTIQLEGQIDVTVYWPRDPRHQRFYGTFRGFLPHHQNRKVSHFFLWTST